jgi:hypothetical protein
MVCYGSFAPTFPAPSFTEAGMHSAQAPASERIFGSGEAISKTDGLADLCRV